MRTGLLVPALSSLLRLAFCLFLVFPAAITSAEGEFRVLERLKCADLWSERLIRVRADRADIIKNATAADGVTVLSPADLEQLDKLSTKLASIRVELAYCAATYADHTDLAPEPDGMYIWHGGTEHFVGGKPGASGELPYPNLLFVSSRCSGCWGLVKEINDWIIGEYQSGIMDDILIGNYILPGEDLDEFNRRFNARRLRLNAFEEYLAVLRQQLIDCQDRVCSDADQDKLPGVADTAASTGDSSSYYRHFRDKTNCNHAECLTLAVKIRINNRRYNGVYARWQEKIREYDTLARKVYRYSASSGSTSEKRDEMRAAADAAFREAEVLGQKKMDIHSELLRLSFDLEDCEKKRCPLKTKDTLQQQHDNAGYVPQPLPSIDYAVLLPSNKAGFQAKVDFDQSFDPSQQGMIPALPPCKDPGPVTQVYKIGDGEEALFFSGETLPLRTDCDYWASVRRQSQREDQEVSSEFNTQWGLTAIGMTGASGANFPVNRTAEDSSIIVAVIDSGLDLGHPGLIGRVWQNTAEPTNGEDDDGNGLIDDDFGWNFVAHNSDAFDDNGHGTLVAGVIAAVADAGTASDSTVSAIVIMPLKATNDVGRGNDIAVAAAITYAVDQGAKLINISLGGEAFSKAEQVAIDYANDNGVLVIVAAGNQNSTTDSFWPAALDSVITVAATDKTSVRAPYSNWGKAVDIAAPGSDIISLRAAYTDVMRYADKGYQAGDNIRGQHKELYIVSGTSFAAPYVVGVAALIMAANPELSAAQVQRMLLQSATDIGEPGTDSLSGYGLLNAPAALKAHPAFFISAHIDGISTRQAKDTVLIVLQGSADADNFSSATVQIGQGESPSDWTTVGGTLKSSVTDGVLTEFDVINLQATTRWTIKLVVKHKNGKLRETRFDLALQ